MINRSWRGSFSLFSALFFSFSFTIIDKNVYNDDSVDNRIEEKLPFFFFGKFTLIFFQTSFEIIVLSLSPLIFLISSYPNIHIHFPQRAISSTVGISTYLYHSYRFGKLKKFRDHRKFRKNSQTFKVLKRLIWNFSLSGKCNIRMTSWKKCLISFLKPGSPENPRLFNLQEYLIEYSFGIESESTDRTNDFLYFSTRFIPWRMLANKNK